MHVFCVDDDDFHRGKIQEVVSQSCELKGISDCTIIGCCDGDDFLKKVDGITPKFITLDINMPNKDGLSTLVRYKKLNPSVPIYMASSENESVVKRLHTKKRDDIDPAKKEQLLSKVVDRVKNGVHEPDKLNSVLEAVANLGMDPIAVAKSYGANGFIIKPFDRDQTAEILARLL
ncbi:MAG: hypothetical protein COB04_18895 [Gammaproteobacteria bacterium]|nr:MAG: hypothetical protein COB04_18895 [Gammaproteobacteria bacterium]